ncbi:MAG: hypothetical protein IBJ09_11345 [Bacteroidia bacterium]|nr:hypothetical protein [Bacteroidia bacterium]
MSLYEFLQARGTDFWVWEENEGVIAVRNGMTIAYREHVMHILSYLSPEGIPPFGALLMCIAATNPVSNVLIQQVEDIMSAHIEGHTRNDMEPCIAFMKTLGSLPASYKSGERKLLLFRTIFEKCHNQQSARMLRQLLKQYNEGRLTGGKLNQLRPNTTVAFEQECRTMALLHRRYPSPEKILNAMAGVPDLDAEAFPLPDAAETDTVPGDFVEELERDPRTFHAGSLIRRIWSGLSIPFHNTLPSMQPMGGVSDLTNKGDYDRLLISEYANDDLLFLSRLANNEALYLHREVPPESNDLERIILLDISLKNWGTPKIIAHALMLAIARHPKTDICCRAFLLGESCTETQFGEIADIIDGMQKVEAVLHPAQGLQQFLDEHKGQKMELMLISTREVLKRPEMQKVLQENPDRIRYRIHTDLTGEVSLYKRMQNSLRFIQTIRLPLEELWNPPKKKPLGSAPAEPAGEVCPLLYPGQHSVRRQIPVDHQLYHINNEKSILRTYDTGSLSNRKGWEMVYHELPYITTSMEMGRMQNGSLYLLIFHARNMEITLIDTGQRHLKKIPFPDWQFSSFQNFIFHEDHFYYLHAKWSWKIDPESGSIEKTEGPPDKEMIRVYRQREQQYQDAFRVSSTFHPVLKNISRIFISSKGTLVVNNHELSAGETIRFEAAGTDCTPQIPAATENRLLFRFHDGSRIRVQRTGMLHLQSSDLNIPDIWIPSVLESDLGLAAGNSFCGSDYYHPDKDGTPTLSLPAGEFSQRYLQPFIQRILSYGITH